MINNKDNDVEKISTRTMTLATERGDNGNKDNGNEE